MSKTLYSVVVPVYNSQESLEELYVRIAKVFDFLQADHEVIFVNDCSKDKSWEVLEKLQTQYSQITAIHLNKNFGQHNALMCGFQYAKGDFIITIDDDLQIPPEGIIKLVQEQQKSQAELVYGVYAQKKHNLFRNLGSNMVQMIFRYIFKTTGNITSFRLFSKNLCDSVRQHKQSFVFVDGLLHWHTQFISRVLVEHQERQFGSSGYSLKKLISLTSNLMFNFTTLPLRFLTYFGAFVAVVSFLFGAYFIARKVFYDVPLGFTAQIVTEFFSTSIVLLVIGVIGEYISRMYSLQNDKPQFSIKKIKKK